MRIPFGRRRPRVLVLDDDRAMQRLVATLLKRDGHAVDVVGTGRAAIEAIGASEYDAILLDLMMPTEGGVTVIQHLRETRPELLARVIILTATPTPVLRSFEKEVFAIVQKPFEADDLRATVKRLV